MTELIRDCCLKALRAMPDQSANLCFTSPPYNMNLRIRNGKYVSRQIVKELSTKYEGFDDNLPMDDYFEFNREVVAELLRVSGLVFYNVQIVTGNKPALFKLMGHFAEQIKELIVWDKVNAQPAIGQGVLNSQYELIIVLQSSSPEARKFDEARFDRGTMSNLWSIKRERLKIDGAYHGATFPTELAGRVISNFSKVGDVVIDPFMGLGTSGVVARLLNRKYIGIELLERYFEIAKKRIEGVEV